MIIKILRFIISLGILTIGLPIYLLVVIGLGIINIMTDDPEFAETKEIAVTPFRYLLFKN